MRVSLLSLLSPLALLLGCEAPSGTLAGRFVWDPPADDDDAGDDDTGDDDAGDDDAGDDDAGDDDAGDDDAGDDDAGDDDAGDDDTAPSDRFLGYVHDQDTILTTDYDLMQALWVRIDGNGEDGMTVVELRPGIYEAGPNGRNNAGGMDDVLITSLAITDVTVTVGDWIWIDEEQPSPPWYPSGHTNEGDIATYDGAGSFTAGVDTGTLPFTVSYPGYPDLDSILQVVPPDFCPLGDHFGGPNAPGFCQ
jgi:hypothetical protein